MAADWLKGIRARGKELRPPRVRKLGVGHTVALVTVTAPLWMHLIGGVFGWKAMTTEAVWWIGVMNGEKGGWEYPHLLAATLAFAGFGMTFERHE